MAVIIFSGVLFGVGHGLDLDTFLTTGLLYGVPLAAVFAMRDWEHAVGAHYMINMIPTLAVFLENF
jgi:membrane protease YdiL (CAAX protease family)